MLSVQQQNATPYFSTSLKKIFSTGLRSSLSVTCAWILSAVSDMSPGTLLQCTLPSQKMPIVLEKCYNPIASCSMDEEQLPVFQVGKVRQRALLTYFKQLKRKIFVS